MIDIQIGISCEHNSKKYVDFLIKSVERTISNFDRVEFILGMNKPDLDYSDLQDKYPIKIVERITTKSGSQSHGKCLNKIFEHMDKKYGVIVDCDVVFLEKDWDMLLTDRLDDKNIIIGAEYIKTGHKYINFPMIIFCLFNTQIMKKIEMSFHAPLKNVIVTKATEHIYGHPKGTVLFADTGGNLPVITKRNGYDGIPMKMVKADTEESKFMKSKMRGEEFQLNGTPVCSHVGRSTSRDFDTDQIIIDWKNRTEEYLCSKNC